MYNSRVKVFIGISLAVLLLCVLRLAQLQLSAPASVQAEIDQLKELRSRSRQFKTLRGKILDRRGEILAVDMPQFQVYIDYELSRFLDDRFALARLTAVKMENTRSSLYAKVHQEIRDKRQDLQRIVEKCTRFGLTREQILGNIQALNDDVWNARSFLCWRRGPHDPNLVAQYGGFNNVPMSKALADLELQYPDAAVRSRQVAAVDLVDLDNTYREGPLVELKTEDDIFAAQLEFTDVNDVRILPIGHRYYPYRSTAAQTIGWVGQATQPRDLKAFAGDPLTSYRTGEVCGREDGVEYVCESLLRGRRGEEVYDIDKQLVRQSETQYGQDVQLTLDVDLQKQIEQRLTDPKVNPGYCHAPMAAALLDIRTGDILALISLPSYDLNVARYRYNQLEKDPNRPLVNRTLNYSHYPPASVAKPMVLIAGLESGVITPDKVISCPDAAPPVGWPKCLIYTKSGTGHDARWTNNARNAMKGSCNVYFSHLADAIEPRLLQQWFYNFGYGREISLACPVPPAPGSIPRHFQQFPGQIGSTMISAATDTASFEEIPPLRPRDRKMFGIGQGNFRVTPLQVANAFATIARRGQAKPPRLFLSPEAPPSAEPVDLRISPTTLQVVHEGMNAVVNERGGTAYEEFVPSGLGQHGVTVYGKTGSTEDPFNAWFAGFAEDKEGARIALALVVEGGQHGGSDAGPLAREILQLCVQQGYLGEEAPAAGK